MRVRDWIVQSNQVKRRISIPEVMQWLLAIYSAVDEERQNFTHNNDLRRDYVQFSLEIGEDIIYQRITSVDHSSMEILVVKAIKKADGSIINPDPNYASVDTLILDSICRYTIFLESIRQQICTGVGLRCPFWTGSGCCKFRPLLQRTYGVCKPWNPFWKHHWQRPPCLE